MKIGLFYGSSTCYTEMAAEKIREILGEDLVDLHNLKDVSPKLMEDYSILILGIPTWDFGELQEDWEAIWPQLPALDLKGKIVAMYGMGDQLGSSTRWACCTIRSRRWAYSSSASGRPTASSSPAPNR